MLAQPFARAPGLAHAISMTCSLGVVRTSFHGAIMVILIGGTDLVVTHKYATILIIACLSACVGSFTGESVNEPIRETGFAASARVLEIWETGVRVNDNPVVGFRLEVMLEDGSAYEAVTKNVVSILHIPQIQPGAVLPVKVDPEDPSRVALDIYEGR